MNALALGDSDWLRELSRASAVELEQVRRELRAMTRHPVFRFNVPAMLIAGERIADIAHEMNRRFVAVTAIHIA